MDFRTLKKDLPDLVDASYKSQKQAEKDLAKKGYIFDKDLSSMTTKVFLDPNKEPVIVERGSKRLSDWVDDALIGIGAGRLGHRHKNTVRLVKKVEAKYHKPVNVVGHSYGGWLAENSGTKGKILTYNKAVGLGDIGKNFGENQLDTRSLFDIISLPSLTQNVRRTTRFNTNIDPIYAHSTQALKNRL